MLQNGDADPPLDVEAYNRLQARLVRRAKALPSDMLEPLAREAIKRLASRNAAAIQTKLAPTPDDIETLSNALIGSDDTAAANLIRQLQADGVSAEVVYVEYMAPAARLLGDWWDADKTPFWKVTIGTGRILAIMRTMSDSFQPENRAVGKSVTFASVPGEQHMMGLRMATDLFRKDGWNVNLLIGLDHDQLVAEIEEAGNVLIGLTMSSDRVLDALARLVIAIRVSHPTARVFVSGPRISKFRTRLTAIDVDGVAEDVDTAKVLMTRVLENGMA